MSNAQEHSTMSLTRARTQTAPSGVEHTNHEATTPSPLLHLGHSIALIPDPRARFSRTTVSYISLHEKEAFGSSTSEDYEKKYIKSYYIVKVWVKYHD